MNAGINAAFIQLKPVCDSIATKPTIEKLKDLREIVKRCPVQIIQQLHEFIIFPLYITLENDTLSTTNTTKQEVLDTLAAVLQLIKLTKIKVFTQLCMSVTKQVFDKRTSTLYSTADEELKLSTINCMHILFKNLSTDIITELYSRNYSVYFPQCIYLCVQIAKTEKMRELRLNAINCLLTISYVHDEADTNDVVLRKQVADTIMFFLPGVAIALRDISLADEKQGHKITSLAIRALNRIIALHMESQISLDEKQVIFEFPKRQKIEEEDESIETTQETKNIEGMLKRFKIETRSPDWYKKTGENLQKIIESLIPLQHHYHEKVRYELSLFCQTILFKCSKYMENSFTFCIDMLISLSEDENIEVCQNSRNALQKISQDLNSTFFEILTENFYNVITRLPRIMNGTDVQQQLSGLNLLVGYLRILGPKHLFHILHSSNHLKRLINSLILISELEKSNITLFEEYAIRDFESITESQLTWKHFKYIDNKSLFTKLQLAIQLLTESQAIEIIVDTLCDMFSNDSEHKNEVVFLLNGIISVNVEKNESRFNMISNIFKLYTDEENWYLEMDAEVMSLSGIHSNIVQMCLLVEGVGYMAGALGVGFEAFLLKTLYIVLERAGSAQPMTSAAGITALVQISKACKYKSVTDLIVKNTDYFSFHVIKRLAKLEFNPNVLNVLNVVMKYSTIDVLPSIMDIINGVLLQSCDKFQQHNATPFLKVFYSFIQNLRRWLNINPKNDSKLIKLLNEYKQNMDVLYAMYETDFSDDITDKSAREMYDEDLKKAKDELENENYEENEAQKSEPPENIKLAVAVLKRSLNFLPSKDRDRKLLVLSILKEGIEIISPWEDEFLPLVHLIWSPLVDRFKETNDPLIINKSFDLLTVLAKYSKDFIRIRTSKNVLPVICATLKTLADQSYLKDRGSAYRYTQEYKLQIIILSNLAQLVSDLEMSTTDVTQVTSVAELYLSNKQPLPLQECCVSFYKSLACYDFDSVWLALINIWGPPNSDCDAKIELRNNTECLLKTLEVMH